MNEEKVKAALQCCEMFQTQVNNLATACELLSKAVKEDSNLKRIGLEAILTQTEPETVENKEEQKGD